MDCWKNQKTGKPEYHDGFPPVDRLKEFMLQNLSAEILYGIYTEDQNKTPEEAMLLVLKASVGSSAKGG